MYRILHLNTSNFYGGPEKQIVEHLKRLDPNRFIGMVASFAENNQEKEILKKASEAHLTNFAIPVKGPFDKAAFRILKAQLIDHKIDLLCTHGFKATITGWWVARKLRLPLIVFSRGYTAENFKVAFYEWLERRVLRKAEAIVSVSEGQKRKLEKYRLKHSKHYVVHNAVDARIFRPVSPELKKNFLAEHAIPASAIIAAAVGRLSPEKGHEILIKSLGQLKESEENLFLLICGDGVCQLDLENLSRKLHLTDRIKFLGFRSDIDTIYQLMDFLVLPSYTEGLPNVVLEAFAYKKPVVVTRVGGVPELVTDGQNGFIVPAGDIEALARGISKLYHDEELRLKMGSKGYDTVREKFSFENQNKKLEEIYRNILAKVSGYVI